jgi:hypothetical protein
MGFGHGLVRPIIVDTIHLPLSVYQASTTSCDGVTTMTDCMEVYEDSPLCLTNTNYSLYESSISESCRSAPEQAVNPLFLGRH